MRLFLPLLLLFCFSFSSFSPKPKASEDAPLSKEERLFYTCKVWGFLKYYHPKVGTGVFDWDDKLIKVLANTTNITTEEQLSNYMYRWIYAFGPRKPCSSCRKNNGEVFLKNFDLSWTQRSPFSGELQATFRDIEKNRFQGDHYYVEKGNAGQFVPKSESGYYDLNLKDEKHKLLPLFRYWNYIEYFFPYKYQTDQDWDNVLREMIPKFLAIQTRLDLHKAMLELVVKVDDSQAGLVTKTLDQMPYYSYLPARIEMVEDQAIVTEIIDVEKASMADLQIGDVITSINGQSVKALHRSHDQYIWGSNEAVKERSAYHTLFMGVQNNANATIDRGGTTRSASLTLYPYSEISYKKKGSTKPKWEIPRDSVGVVDLSKLEKSEVDGMMAEMMDTKVLILDVRESPRGTFRALAKYLKPTSDRFAWFLKPDFSYPGKFVWEGRSACGEENEDYYKGQVILLVDENTQGHGEFTCMCLQTAPNVVTIGSQTAGTNGNTSKFSLIQNIPTQFSGTGIFYPDGKEVQRVGLALDMEVRPTLDGIRNGRDEVMETAMEAAEQELERLKEEARLAYEAKLDSMRRDSIRLLEMRFDSIPMDSLNSSMVDSLRRDYDKN